MNGSVLERTRIAQADPGEIGRLGWLADVSAVDLPAVDALVTGLVQVQTAIAGLHALEASMLSAAVDVVAAAMAARGIGDDQQLPWRELSAELATAVHVSDRTMQARMGDAAALVRGFVAVHAALRDGRIDRARARVIVEAGSTVPDGPERARYEQDAVAQAEHLTAGRLGAVCRQLADRAHPESIDERHARAKRGRRVGLVDLDDGMSRLFAELPSTLARAIYDRLTQMAKTVQRNPVAAAAPAECETARGASATACGPQHDERTLDQIRADVFSDILLTAVPDGHGPADVFEKIVAHVQVLVPAGLLNPAIDTTGADAAGDGGLFDDPHVPAALRRTPARGAGVGTGVGAGTGAWGTPPATLTGSGPIDTATARILAGTAAGWDRVFTDPYTGGVLCVDRHDPSAQLKRLLQARDEHCRFPGCRQPVHRCEIDHTVRYRDGGPTCSCNLEHLCKGHHILKHHSRWRVRQLAGGVLEWTSPTGRVHTDTPAPIVRFVDTTAGPPGAPPPF